MTLKYNRIAISSSIASGTTTLAQNLKESLGWKYVNAGQIQRDFDRKHHINENAQGAVARSDKHEREIEAMTKKMLENEENLIYEAWLAGFVAQNIKNVLKVLLVCSHEDIRIDRVANRENISINEAKLRIIKREAENIKKWQKLYGQHDFWNQRYFNLVIDTYSSGPMETLGKVLDELGFRHK